MSSIAMLFVLQPAVLGFLSYPKYNDTYYPTVAIILYLAVGFTSVLFYKTLKMPLWLAITNLTVATLVPLLVNSVLDLNSRGSHATWYVTGIAALMCITAFRDQIAIAWIGTGVLLVQVLTWGGLDFFWNSGMVGALGLVAAGNAISLGLSRAARQTESYLAVAKSVQSLSAKETAVRNERSSRLSSTLQGAKPLLEKIAKGALTPDEKNQAKLLEAELRDEIRGRQLLNEVLRESVRSARLRSVEVILLDEGGLGGLGEEEATMIRNRLARELDSVEQGRVTIRSPRDDRYRATFVASRAGTPKPDVWLQL